MNRAAAREVANSPAMRGYMAQKGKDYLLYSAHSSATLTESPSRNQKYENLGAKRCGFHRCVQLFPETNGFTINFHQSSFFRASSA
jgi:hypothetical protein